MLSFISVCPLWGKANIYNQVTDTSTVQLVFKIHPFMVLCLFLVWQLHLLAIKAITTTQVLHFVADSFCLAYIIQHLYKY